MNSPWEQNLVDKKVLYDGKRRGRVTSVDVSARKVYVDFGDGVVPKAVDYEELTMDGIPVRELMFRGTGRTTRQLIQSPQKFFFVVRNWAMMNHARTLIRKHVPEKDVEIVLLDNIRRLTGVSMPIVVDHDAVDHMSARDMEWLQPLMSRNNP